MPHLIKDTVAVRPIWGIGLIVPAGRADKIGNHGSVQNLHPHLRLAIRPPGRPLLPAAIDPGEEAYRGSYDKRTLSGWAGAFSSRSERGLDVFCYFDNDEGGYAAQNAMELQEMING